MFSPGIIRTASARATRLAVAVAAATASAVAAATMATTASADSSASQDVSPPPMVPMPVPQGAPATAVGPDGVTSTIIGSNETIAPGVPATPELPPRDFVMNGNFVGKLQSPSRGSSLSGSVEAGYQLHCLPGHGPLLGVLGALKPSFENFKVAEESFTGNTHSVEIRNYHIQIDCVGTAFIRSYAILTHNAGAGTAVVSYYGNEVPAALPAQP